MPILDELNAACCALFVLCSMGCAQDADPFAALPCSIDEPSRQDRRQAKA
ncbi:MAG TPA: hypothetical protein VK509_00785 [Polyangiales bacterium]|nr:hypothetical protein [Polyangiales bacterium]